MKHLPNLLIVDDSEENLALLEAAISNLNVNVIKALSGVEALEKIRGLDLALAIIDVRMPGMNGYELLSRMNHERPANKVPVIFITANSANHADILEGYGSGAVDFIFKPVNSHVLNSKIMIFVDLFHQKQTIIQSRRAAKFLEQTRKNYEIFFNTIDEFLFVIDMKGKILHANTTVFERLGYTRDEVIGKSVLRMHPQERWEEVGRILGEILVGLTSTCPVPLATKSGVLIPVETTVSHGSWDGNPVVFGVSKDMTQIVFSEEKFSRVFRINPSACGLSDFSTGKFIEINDAFKILLGYDREEAIGKTAGELGILTPEGFRELYQKAGNREKVFNIEADLRAKNGEIKHVLLSAESINIQDKKYRYTVVQDFTEHRKDQEAIRQSESNLAEAQAIARTGSWEWDMVAGTVKCSKEMYRVYDIDPDTFNGKADFIINLIHPDDVKAFMESMSTNLAGGYSPSLTYRVIHRDGSIHYLAANGRLEYNDAGQPVKSIGTVQDITEQKMTEDALKESRDQLRQLNQHVGKIAEEQRLAISRELHDDLGQALTAIEIDLGIIRQKVTDPEAVLKIIKTSSLVSETIKTVKRLTSQLRPEIFDILGLEATIECYTQEFAQRNRIEVFLNMDSGIAIDDEDTALIIFRIMQESLTNIARHSAASRVDIRFSKTGDYIDLRISDNGIGITEDQIESKKSFGIMSMKERAFSLGGTLDIYPEKDQGTTVKLTLPLNKGIYENSYL